MTVDYLLGLGLLGLIFAYITFQIRYEEKESENKDKNTPKGLKFEMIWTNGTKIIFFILTMIDCMIMLWSIYTILGDGTNVEVITTTSVGNTTTIQTNSTANGTIGKIVFPLSVLFTFAVIFLTMSLMIWLFWVLWMFIIGVINRKNGKNW